MTMPYIELISNMPRRLFAELNLLVGSEVETLFQEAQAKRRLAVYWQIPVGDGRHRPWAKARLEGLDEQLGRRLPPALWQTSLRLVQIEKPDQAKILDDPAEAARYLDISLGVAGKGEKCGLYLAWNPQPSAQLPKISGLCVTDDRMPAAWPQALVGQHCLVLHISRLALLPIEADDAIKDIPPNGGIVDKVFNLWKDRSWQFRPNRPWVAVFKPANPVLSASASFLALDFGTVATTIACLPEHPSGGDLPDFSPLRQLQPWTHTTCKPNLDRVIGNGRYKLQGFVWGSKSPLVDGIFQPVPTHVRKHRQPIGEDSGGVTPSLIYGIHIEADETMTPPVEYAIGAEAEAFLRGVQSAGHSLADPARFIFSPKRLVGSDVAGSRVQEMLQGKTDHRHPVEQYLSEVLDQALHQSLANKSLQSRVSSLCYSYPVTWTKAQREAFRANLTNALNQSFMREYLHNNKTDGEINPAYSLDEASAAFLGVTVRRFQGLEGEDLVRMFAPFEPDPQAARQYPKTIRVLVVDCGGGTTDMVLLEMLDDGRIGGDAAVQSKVVRHFAIDKGGVEITRKVAEYLKALLKKYGTLSEEVLRTNLFDADIANQFIGNRSTVSSQKNYRHRFTLQLYQAAEQLKVEASNGRAVGTALWDAVVGGIESLLHPKNSGMGVDSTGLPTTLDPALLKKWTEESYQYVINQIKLWFAMEEQAGLDMLLLSGRSSQLPGLRQMIIEAIPPGKRPLAIDCAEVGNYSFAVADNPSAQEQNAAKNLVCEGLAVNYWNTIGSTHKKRIVFEPIDETRRTRAIGILAESVTTKPLEHFDPTQALLIEADNKAVEPEAEYPYAITKNLSKGFYLGINFGGKKEDSTANAPPIDPPQPFLRVDIESKGTREAFDRLVFVFQQKTTTEVVVKRIELHKEGGVEAKENIQMLSGRDTEVQIGKLHVFLRPYLQIEDFRMTGRIHLAEPAIDSDRG